MLLGSGRKWFFLTQQGKWRESLSVVSSLGVLLNIGLVLLWVSYCECYCACEFWWSFSASHSNLQSTCTNQSLFIWEPSNEVIENQALILPFSLWKNQTIKHKPTQTRANRPALTMMSPILGWKRVFVTDLTQAELSSITVSPFVERGHCNLSRRACPKSHGKFMISTAGKSSLKYCSL